MSKERKVSKMTTAMFNMNLKNEHLLEALVREQGLDFMYTFLIGDMGIRHRV